MADSRTSLDLKLLKTCFELTVDRVLKGEHPKFDYLSYQERNYTTDIIREELKQKITAMKSDHYKNSRIINECLTFKVKFGYFTFKCKNLLDETLKTLDSFNDTATLENIDRVQEQSFTKLLTLFNIEISEFQLYFTNKIEYPFITENFEAVKQQFQTFLKDMKLIIEKRCNQMRETIKKKTADAQKEKCDRENKHNETVFADLEKRCAELIKADPLCPKSKIDAACETARKECQGDYPYIQPRLTEIANKFKGIIHTLGDAKSEMTPKPAPSQYDKLFNNEYQTTVEVQELAKKENEKWKVIAYIKSLSCDKQIDAANRILKQKKGDQLSLFFWTGTLDKNILEEIVELKRINTLQKWKQVGIRFYQYPSDEIKAFEDRIGHEYELQSIQHR